MSPMIATLRSIAACGIMVLALALGACGDGDRTPIVPDPSAAGASDTSMMQLSPTRNGLGDSAVSTARSTANYKLGPNDHTRIIVYGQPTLTGEYALDGNGVLSFPLIGNVQASGMTPTELQHTIAAKLDPDYLHNPSVSVEVSTRRPFYVIGEVQKPGSYPFVTDMTVLNAIATAGGQTYRANMGNFYVKRLQNGRTVRVAATQETMLHPGDTVEVRERYF
ncbi:MAG: polysaccharide export protein [Proteobacteria bacterium]|nr:polysaccharide export protein [Pseudomonadota bacterium]